MAQVPTTNFNALKNNTEPGVTASPSLLDAALQDTITTVNTNDTEFTNFKNASELAVADGAITTAKIRDGAVTSSKITEGTLTPYTYTKAQTDTLLAGVVAGSLPQVTIDAIALSATEQAKDYTDAQIILTETYADNAVTVHGEDFVKHIGDGGLSTGTSTAYTVGVDSHPAMFVNNMGVVFTCHLDSTGSPTLRWATLDPKPMVNVDGSPVSLKANGIYTFRYSTITENFILQGEGGGVAVAGQTEESLVFADTITKGDPVYTNTTFTKLANPATLPASTAYGVAFSTDGVYMATADSGSPYINIYKRTGDVFTKLTNPATLPVSAALGVAFSADGTYLAVAQASTPYIVIYKRSGDVFIKLSDPATLPTGQCNGISFSTDGTYLAIVHATTPFVTIYKRSGDVFTKLTNPSSLPTGQGNGVAFSSDGTYLTVAHSTTPFITIYKRSGDVFTKLTNPSTLPTGTSFGVSFSTDVTYMAVAHSSSPYVTIYKRSGDVFTKLSNPSSLPTASEARGITFNYDGSYLSIVLDATPYVYVYRRSGDTFTKIADPSTLPTGSTEDVAFSVDKTYMAVVHATTPYVTIYKAEYDKVYKSLGLMTDFIATKTGAGYAKESGTPGETKKIIRIWR